MRRLSTFTEHVEWIGARQLRIPRFQRDVVWDVERQRGFAEAYIGQRITTSPIVWWTPVGRREHILLDGLQRLTALDVPMTRDDGAAQVRSSVALDVFTQKVVDFADRPGVFSFRVLGNLRRLFDALYGHPPGSPIIHAAIEAIDLLRSNRLVVVEVEGSAEDAIEAMIGLNRPGVIYDLDELRANIHATAAEYGVSR